MHPAHVRAWALLAFRALQLLSRPLAGSYPCVLLRLCATLHSHASQLLAPGGVPIAPGAVKRTVLTPHPDLAAAAAADGGATGRHDAAVAGGQIIAENISRGQLQPVRELSSPLR